MDAIWQDFLLDNAGGAYFVLKSLTKRKIAAPKAGKLPAVSEWLGRLVVEGTLDKAAKSEPQFSYRIFEEQNQGYLQTNMLYGYGSCS